MLGTDRDSDRVLAIKRQKIQLLVRLDYQLSEIAPIILREVSPLIRLIAQSWANISLYDRSRLRQLVELSVCVQPIERGTPLPTIAADIVFLRKPCAQPCLAFSQVSEGSVMRF